MSFVHLKSDLCSSCVAVFNIVLCWVMLQWYLTLHSNNTYELIWQMEGYVYRFQTGVHLFVWLMFSLALCWIVLPCFAFFLSFVFFMYHTACKFQSVLLVFRSIYCSGLLWPNKPMQISKTMQTVMFQLQNKTRRPYQVGMQVRQWEMTLHHLSLAELIHRMIPETRQVSLSFEYFEYCSAPTEARYSMSTQSANLT